MNWSRQIEANAVTTAASAFLLAKVSAALFNFHPSASNPIHAISAAPATAPRQKGFQPAGNSGILNSIAHLPLMLRRRRRTLDHRAPFTRAGAIPDEMNLPKLEVRPG